MNAKTKLRILFLICFVVGLGAFIFLCTADIAVLNPKGMIAVKERDFLVFTTFLMLIVVVPVLLLTFIIAWRYRAENKQAKYHPEWEYSLLAESLWWGIPLVIIIILGVFNWKGCHELDPFKPIENGKKPMTIQVVALQWKWLFIYPEQNIATVNFVQFPVDTPIVFELTSDAPMNAFWIPELGGQIYAMSGMTSKLHLISHTLGNFRGCSSNISGTGFAGMTFTAKASTEEEFASWASSAGESLTRDEYLQLLKPSEYNPVAFYRLADQGLFEWIVMKYMEPGR